MSFAIQTSNEWLAAVSKPAIDSVGRQTLFENDWLVLCGGFEDRALGVLQSMAEAHAPFKVLLIRYEPIILSNKENKIFEVCQRFGIKVVECIYNRQEPAGFGEVFLGHLTQVEGKIILDVSSMSRLLIVQLIVALATRKNGFDKCYVGYSEAEIYPPTQEESASALKKSESDPTYSIFFLSSGVYEVTILPELSATSATGIQTRLIAFPSFDAHYLNALRAEIQPSRFSFIEGSPPDSQNKWRQKAISEVNCIDKIPGAEILVTSTLDYRETLDCLLNLYSRYSIHERLIISPTGSKMQTVAVGIFRAIVQDVQIIYPTPTSFLKPDSYTHGVGAIHYLSLDGYRIQDSPGYQSH